MDQEELSLDGIERQGVLPRAVRHVCKRSGLGLLLQTSLFRLEEGLKGDPFYHPSQVESYSPRPELGVRWDRDR